MVDFADYAQQEEDLALQEALHRHRSHSGMTDLAAESLTDCERCDEPIPEARRLAIKGCTTCIKCQSELDARHRRVF